MSAADLNVAGVELAPGVRVPESALRVQFARSSGPGGQNVNKLNTKAEIWIGLDALAPHLSYRAMARLERLAGRRLTRERQLHFSGEASRSQEQNRRQAFQRLRELLIAAMVEPKIRRKTKPSRGSKQRRLDQKKHRGAIKAHRRSTGD